MGVLGAINNRGQVGEPHAMYLKGHTQHPVDSYYNIVLCSEYPAAPGSNLGIRICSKTNREKKTNQKPTQQENENHGKDS